MGWEETDWSAITADNEAFRRAGGRRRYNALRQFRAAWRRMEVMRLIRSGELGDILDYGTEARIARFLGVSRSTICRDVRTFREMERNPNP